MGRRPCENNTMRVWHGTCNRHKYIRITSDWLNDCNHFILSYDGEYFTIKKCFGLEIPRYAKSGRRYRYGVRFSTMLNMPLGEYKFAEDESDKDKLVFYHVE